MTGSPSLFESHLPQGLHYRENLITEADERVLLDAIASVAALREIGAASSLVPIAPRRHRRPTPASEAARRATWA